MFGKLVTMAIMTKTHKLSNGSKITFLSDPSLNLFVITDCSNFGPDWIRIHYKKGIYTTSCLLGSRENELCPVARFLAPIILGVEEPSVSNVSNSSNGETSTDIGDNSTSGGIEADPFVVNGMGKEEEKEITLSISLRKTDPVIVREISRLLKQPHCLDIVPVQRPMV